MRPNIQNFSDEELTEVFRSDEPLNIAASRMHIPHWTLRNRWIALFGKEAYEARKHRIRSAANVGEKNPMHGKTGSLSSNWKGGRFQRADGYIAVQTPSWWTGGTTGGSGNGAVTYVLEHRLVMAKKLGLTDLPEGHHVHHIDANVANNDPANLQLMTAVEHKKLHVKGYRIGSRSNVQNFSDEELTEVFFSNEPFREAASRMRVAQRVLRERWLRMFGAEAFRARKSRLYSAGNFRRNQRT